MKKELLYLIAVFCLLMACQEEDYYPPGLRPYQVEYILTGGSQKIWFVQNYRVNGESQPLTSCQDSILWSFEVVGDSISAYQLEFDENCIYYDTTVFGSMEASGVQEFRDSLLYELPNGNTSYMIVKDITSELLSVSYRRSGNEYETYLITGQVGVLARQVEAMLYGEPDDFKTWQLISTSVNGVNDPLEACTDSTFFMFSKFDADLRLDFIQPTADCESFDTTFYGNVSLRNSESGYFEGMASASEGSITEISFSGVSTSSFTIDYVIGEDTVQSEYNQ